MWVCCLSAQLLLASGESSDNRASGTCCKCVEAPQLPPMCSEQDREHEPQEKQANERRPRPGQSPNPARFFGLSLSYIVGWWEGLLARSFGDEPRSLTFA